MTMMEPFAPWLRDVNRFIAGQNANLAKGGFSSDTTAIHIIANDQISKAADYAPLVVANNGDGRFGLLKGSPAGLTLFASEFEEGLLNPTSLASPVVNGVANEVSFYAAIEGEEATLGRHHHGFAREAS